MANVLLMGDRKYRVLNDCCKICGLEMRTVVDLTRHVGKHGFTSKEYYDEFVKRDGEGLCVLCGKETRYENFGYKKCCGISCSTKYMWGKENCKKIHSESRKKLAREGRNTTIFIKGQEAWNVGLPSPWTSKRNRIFCKEKHPRWEGGKSFELYGFDFTKSLKRKVLKRDNFTCRICGEYGDFLHCHHVDYDKKNNTIENLVALCPSCHSKTNVDRVYWEYYFGSAFTNKGSLWPMFC